MEGGKKRHKTRVRQTEKVGEIKIESESERNGEKWRQRGRDKGHV